MYQSKSKASWHALVMSSQKDFLELFNSIALTALGYWELLEFLEILNGTIPAEEMCTTFWEGLTDSNDQPLQPSISSFKFNISSGAGGQLPSYTQVRPWEA